MIVVSDTSAITSLIQVGRIEVLAQLYGDIYIPQAVRTELLQTHPSLPAFIHTRGTASESDVRRLCAELDLGEAEAIILAKEMAADYLLIDESVGRQIAIREGVNVIGLLGVLLEGKERGHILSVREATTDLETIAGFRVAERVKQIIFRAAGEA
jgi:predicted nucleic acid-binding protein